MRRILLTILILLACLSFNVSAEVVFETDFANDAGYVDTGTNKIRARLMYQAVKWFGANW